MGHPTKGITVCTPYFGREEKLRELLESVPPGIDKVLIADNSKSRFDRTDEFKLDIEVMNLSFDCGIGKCRNEMAKNTDTEYMLVVDSDMEIPDNWETLHHILDSKPHLGGVSGGLFEHGRFRLGAIDFHDVRGTLVQSYNDVKTELVDGIPVFYTDKISQNALVRTKTTETYNWDPHSGNREHLDFFLGHKREGKWTWAACPTVVFKHKTGGSQRYEDKRDEDFNTNYILEKFGYENMSLGRTEIFDTRTRPLHEEIGKQMYTRFPMEYTVPIKLTMERML